MGMTRSTPVSATTRATASPVMTSRTSPLSARAWRAAATKAFSPAESRTGSGTCRPRPWRTGPAASAPQPGRLEQGRPQPGGVGDVDLLGRRHDRYALDHLDREADLRHCATSWARP